MLPHVFLTAADARPFEIQDLLPADTRFKVLVFVGDSSNAEQRAKLDKLAAEMKGVLDPFVPEGDVTKVFDIMSISTAKKEKVFYTDVPALFRSHWTK